jgi:hypothetical protein
MYAQHFNKSSISTRGQLAEAARRVDADVVEFYSSQRRPSISSVQRQNEAALPEIETAVENQIKDIRYFPICSYD